MFLEKIFLSLQFTNCFVITLLLPHMQTHCPKEERVSMTTSQNLALCPKFLEKYSCCSRKDHAIVQLQKMVVVICRDIKMPQNSKEVVVIQDFDEAVFESIFGRQLLT